MLLEGFFQGFCVCFVLLKECLFQGFNLLVFLLKESLFQGFNLLVLLLKECLFQGFDLLVFLLKECLFQGFRIGALLLLKRLSQGFCVCVLLLLERLFQGLYQDKGLLQSCLVSTRLICERLESFLLSDKLLVLFLERLKLSLKFEGLGLVGFDRGLDFVPVGFILFQGSQQRGYLFFGFFEFQSENFLFFCTGFERVFEFLLYLDSLAPIPRLSFQTHQFLSDVFEFGLHVVFFDVELRHGGTNLDAHFFRNLELPFQIGYRGITYLKHGLEFMIPSGNLRVFFFGGTAGQFLHRARSGRELL